MPGPVSYIAGNLDGGPVEDGEVGQTAHGWAARPLLRGSSEPPDTLGEREWGPHFVAGAKLEALHHHEKHIARVREQLVRGVSSGLAGDGGGLVVAREA